MKKPLVLLAGIGGYGANYLNEFLDAKDPAFIFAGAADPFAASSPRFGELGERGIPVFNTPRDFFASGGRADLAVIAAPIHTHYPYIIDCFDNNCSVLCEKPITGDLSRMDDLIAMEKKSGLFCAVGFQACFAEDTLAIKKDIIDGVFGKPLELKTLNITRRGDSYYKRNNWAGRLAVEGETILDSPLNNGCSHDLQLMLFLLGGKMDESASVVSVNAETWQARPDIENFDAAALRIKTADGVKIHFYTAHCVDIAASGTVGEFRFEKALIRREGKPNAAFTAYFDDGRTKCYEVPSNGLSTKKFYDSLEALNSGRKPVCTLKTARDHLVCVAKTQEFKITRVPAEKLVYDQNTDEKNPFYYLPGLAEAFQKSYNGSALPSETGFTI